MTAVRDRESLADYLVAHRWLDPNFAHDERSVADAVRDAQRFLGGRESDSEAYTWELLEAARCGCPESIVDPRSGLAKWPSLGPIKLHLAAGLPKLSPATWKSLVREAADRVEAVCGLVFVLVDDARQANHVYTPARLDGAGRVLADCELPYGIERQRATVTRIDMGEDWGTSAHQRMISALDVLVHEGGHRDGIPHVPASEDQCVMNPIYNPAWRGELQARDVAEYVRRYGPRPTPAPPRPSPDEIVIRLRGGRVVSIDGDVADINKEVRIAARCESVSIDGYLVSKRPGAK